MDGAGATEAVAAAVPASAAAAAPASVAAAAPGDCLPVQGGWAREASNCTCSANSSTKTTVRKL